GRIGQGIVGPGIPAPSLREGIYTAERIQKITGPRGVSYLVRVEFPPDPVTGKRRQRSKAFGTKREADVHSHVTPDMQRRAADRIDSALFGEGVKAAVK